MEDGRGVRIDEIGDVEERDEMGRGGRMVKKGGGGRELGWLRKVEDGKGS